MITETELKNLSNSPLMVSLSEEQINLIYNSGEIKNYKTGEIIINEGEMGDVLFVILAGEVIITSPPDFELAKLSEANTLISQYEGDFFGEMAILDLEPRSATVIAKENTRVLKIKRELLEKLFNKNQNLKFIFFVNMIRVLSRRLRSSNLRKKNYVEKFNKEKEELDKTKKVEQILIDWNLQLIKLNNELKNEISKRKKIEKKIRKLAIRDSLTNLLNHREFYRKLEDEIKRSKRYNHSFSIIMLDVDNFKKINDTFGHRTGDYVLKNIAKLICKNVRLVDYVARYGGDEFIILMPEINKHQCLIVARRLRQAVSQWSFVTHTEKVVKTTITQGIAEFPADGKFSNILVQVADRSLYKGKNIGKNKIF